MKTKTCQYCGGRFGRPPYKMSKAQWASRRFCSMPCRTLGMKGEGRSTYRVAKKTLAERFWPKVDKKSSEECWPWTGAFEGAGYGYLGGTMGEPATKAHRVSWILHFGSIPDGLCVLHKCDNPPCVNPGHLFTGTRIDNNNDRDSKGRTRHAKGEAVGGSKLKQQDIATIRGLRAQGISQQKLADHFGVSQVAISALLRGKTWKD